MQSCARLYEIIVFDFAKPNSTHSEPSLNQTRIHTRQNLNWNFISIPKYELEIDRIVKYQFFHILLR